MPNIRLVTHHRDRLVMSADDILSLIRAAGFAIPDDAVLCVEVLPNWKPDAWMTINDVFIVDEPEPNVQVKKVSDGSH